MSYLLDKLIELEDAMKEKNYTLAERICTDVSSNGYKEEASVFRQTIIDASMDEDDESGGVTLH